MRVSLHTRPRRPGLATLAGVVALALVALAGCSSAVREAREGDGSGPEKGGTLRLGVLTDLQTATPFSNSSDATNALMGLVYDSLVDYPHDSVTPKPALATSWHSAPDGRSLTLQLRKDVHFQRTAAAVTGFDTSDPHAITLRFDRPLGNVFDLLDALPIVDRATFGKLRTGAAYVGTGPFAFEKWTPGSSLTFKRNDDYWGKKPYLDGVRISIVPDAQSEVSQLRTGQLDAIIGAGNRDLESLGKSGGYRVTPFAGAEQNIYVGSNLRNPALRDVRIRRAIAYAVDRPRILADVFRGVGRPINLPWPTYSPAYDAKANHTFGRDLGRARSLLAEATRGKRTPALPLEFDAGNGNQEATAQIVQSNLADIGLKVDLRPVDHNQYIKQLIDADFAGLWVLSHNYVQYTPSTLAVSAYPFNAEHNASHFESASYAEHADQAWRLRRPTGAKATAVYAALNRDLLDNLFLTELVQTYIQVASSKRVHGIDWSKRTEIHLEKAYLTGR